MRIKTTAADLPNNSRFSPASIGLLMLKSLFQRGLGSNDLHFHSFSESVCKLVKRRPWAGGLEEDVSVFLIAAYVVMCYSSEIRSPIGAIVVVTWDRGQFAQITFGRGTNMSSQRKPSARGPSAKKTQRPSVRPSRRAAAPPRVRQAPSNRVGVEAPVRSVKTKVMPATTAPQVTRPETDEQQLVVQDNFGSSIGKVLMAALTILLAPLWLPFALFAAWRISEPTTPMHELLPESRRWLQSH